MLIGLQRWNTPIWPTEVVTLIQKQAKNRNETGSNLSLGTRLTVLSKRLGRKRCCDTTPDRCLDVIVSLFWLRIVKTNATSSSNIEGFGGIPGPEAYQIKMIRPTSTLAPYKFTSKKRGKFSRLERLYQTRKLKLAFHKYKLENSFFKFQLQKWETAFFRTPIFKFYLLSPISALLLPTCSTSSFQKPVEKVQN